MPALFRSKNSAVLPAFLGDNRGENFFATGGPSAKDTSPVSRAFGDIEEGVRLAQSAQWKIGSDDRREQAKEQAEYQAENRRNSRLMCSKSPRFGWVL
jgi:hypothetical protein